MSRFANLVGVIAGCLVLVAAAAASAQDASGGQSSRPAPQSGPLTVEPVSSGFVFTPEVRFSTVNHSNATFVGGYGGWLYDDALLLGGAWYWMTNGSHGTGMSYGGLVAGFAVPVGNAVRVGARGLFGWGDAGLNQTYTYYYHGAPYTQQAHNHVGFVVFEPQGSVVVRATRTVSFDFSGGYRFTDTHGWNNDLQGAFGSIGVRFGPF
jgi:hypothetical protein